MSTLFENVTWSLVTHPPRKNYCWLSLGVYCEYLPDGSIACLKARLVAKRYTRHMVLTMQRHSHLLLKYLLLGF